MAMVVVGVALLRSHTRVIFLTAASYLFYAAAEPLLVLLLVLSTCVDWKVGQRLASAQSTRSRRGWLGVSLCINLGLLATFKYGNFALDNAAGFLRVLGFDAEPAQFDILLPPGISFYTFQTLSYTIDIYRRKMDPYDSASGFAMYVAFFPQLVAGPIVRAQEFLPQIREAKPLQYARVLIGLELVLLGFFKKVVLADGIARPIATIFDPQKVESLPWIVSALGTCLFAIQIYCDFSGYTDIARGVAHGLGYDLPQNFRWPYTARSPQQFWRRWHISLSSWIRDYLYVPLGGSKRGLARTQFNLFVTMALAGLWHGASWNFVVWGLFYGVWLVVHRMYGAVRDRVWPRFQEENDARSWKARAYAVVAVLGTFALVNVAWVFFRADDLSTASQIIARICTFAPGSDPSWGELVGERAWLLHFCGETELPFSTLAILLVAIPMHWVFADRYRDGMILQWCPRIVRPLAVAAAILFIVMFAREGDPFIYFQF